MSTTLDGSDNVHEEEAGTYYICGFLFLSICDLIVLYLDDELLDLTGSALGTIPDDLSANLTVSVGVYVIHLC